MLPINRKRALHIPHGLAVVAAAVCLVLAFSTDIQSRHDQMAAERSDSKPVQLLAGSEDSRLDATSRAEQRPEHRGEQRPRDAGSRRVPMPLFPHFPGVGGHGG